MMQNSTRQNRVHVRTATSHLALILSMGFASAAFAQETSDAPAVDTQATSVPGQVAEADEQVAEILVTASRAGRTGFTAPTPTTIIGEGLLQARGATNIATVLNEIPAFKSSTTPTTNGVRAINAGAVFADLRGLGSSRTLVLVDGNRFVPNIATGIGGYQVDLNQVPSLMLERAEVVTGGASAQWGSDAVAGVVNLILKKDFEGLRAEVQGGVSQEGDGAEYRIGVVGGLALGDRGNVTIGLDYVKNRGIGDVYTRDWGRLGYGLVANPCPVTGTAATPACATGGVGGPRNYLLPDVRYSSATNGGIITNTPTRVVGGVTAPDPANQLRGITFNADGTLGRFQYGQLVGATFMQGGGSNQGINFNTGVSLAPKVERWIGYGRASYEVADGFEVYGEASYARTKGNAQTLPPRNEQATPIRVTLDNPFIPTALRTEIARLNALPQNSANQITSFNVGRNSVDLGYQTSRIINETKRGVLGFNADLGSTWRLDGAVIYGESKYTQQVFGNRNIRNFNFAADVVGTPTGPQCRAVVAGDPLASGCAPLNIFGEGSPSAAADAYVTGTTFSETQYGQFAANLNLSGQPFDTWAGPVSVAGGVEYRREEQDTFVDAIAERAGFESSNARSLAGDFNVKEAYFETIVPLARDWTLLRKLDLQAAVRFTDYSTSGSVRTWKLGGTWEPFDGLLVRSTMSRDIRAPNIFEITTPAVSTILTRNFGSAGVDGGPSGQVAAENLTRGNGNLDAEKSKTKTIGFSYAPPFIPGLQFSADYFDIRVKGAIALLDPNNIINFCNGTTSVSAEQRNIYCSYISFTGRSVAPYTIDNPYLNIGVVDRRGWDFEASYRLRLDSLSDSLPGAITFRFSGTKYNRFGENVNNAGFVERRDEISAAGTPKWTTNSSITYDDMVLTAQLQMRTTSSGNYNNLFVEGVQINDNSVPGREYFNASVTVRASEQFEFFGVVNNLFDKDPPLIPQNFGYPTVPQFFDTIGRYFRVGARLKM